MCFLSLYRNRLPPCVFPQRATKSSEGRASRVSDCILNTVHNALNKQHRLESGMKLTFEWEKGPDEFSWDISDRPQWIWLYHGKPVIQDSCLHEQIKIRRSDLSHQENMVLLPQNKKCSFFWLIFFQEKYLIILKKLNCVRFKDVFAKNVSWNKLFYISYMYILF